MQKQVQAYHALDGTAIVMDPWTGEILAIANAPDFDPNQLLDVTPTTSAATAP